MERAGYEELPRPSIPVALVYGILTIYILHFSLSYIFGTAIRSPTEVLWYLIVSILPSSFILNRAKRQELEADGSQSQTFAAKSEGLRVMMGLRGTAVSSQRSVASADDSEPTGISTTRCESTAFPAVVTSNVPSGLGNWDNSCYQNSVLQALSSLPSLQTWLERSSLGQGKDKTSTTSALQSLVTQLSDPRHNGSYIWTPAKLKNMSSWQQQDAQEYFSKIMDELDKDTKKAALTESPKLGLEALHQKTPRSCRAEVQNHTQAMHALHTDQNPLEGWNAQRVACTKCGYSEGYSMIPFYCLTVPLGSSLAYDLEDCLDEYTKREAIDGVECRRCTLLQAQDRLNRISSLDIKGNSGRASGSEADESLEPTSKALSLPPEIRLQISHRLRAIQGALDRDDYSDSTLREDCQIPAKTYASSTKTREAVIGRAPQSLVVHINRSVFNEMTGMQSKNFAHVRYPLSLNLGPWMLAAGKLPVRYCLSAVIAHKGAHENGHYISYKRHPLAVESRNETEQGWHSDAEPWYMLSDADVFEITEKDVLHPRAGGVFMLFYERVTGDALMRAMLEEDLALAISTPLPIGQSNDLEHYEPEVTVPLHLGKDPGTELMEPRPSTVCISRYSEPDNDITDYDQSETRSTEEALPFFHAAQSQPVLRTAVPKGMMRDDQIMSNRMAMRV